MKIIVALLTAVSLFTTSIITFAKETETDYSYLEDLSIKEVRTLRNAVDELLDGEEIDTDDIDIEDIDLDSMSVKELKSLRNAINDLLGEESSDDSSKEEDIELKPVEEECLLCLQTVKDNLKNPESLQVHDIWYCTSYKDDLEDLSTTHEYEDYVIIDLSAQNSMGGLTRDYIFFSVGDEEDYVNFSDIKDKDWESEIPVWQVMCIGYMVNIDEEGYAMDTDKIVVSLK